jgi:glutamate synthase domain-containing protein 3
MVELEELNEDDRLAITDLLHNHYTYTKSPLAKEILDNFSKELKRFVKVMPLEYKRILEQKEVGEKLDLMEVADG